MKKTLVGQILLMAAALIWGSSFVVMKSAVDFLTPHVLLFIRFALGTLFMTMLFFREVKAIQPGDFLKGALAGVALYLAYTIQTFGLMMTTPGKNAFLTAIYCAIVPFLVWIFDKKRPDRYNVIAALLCFVGVGFVSIDSSLSINQGDLLTIAGGLMYALHIIIVKKFTQETTPIQLTTLQFLTAAILALCSSLIFEDITLLTKINSHMILQLFYLAFFATTLALLFQNIGQNMVSECSASILLSLESVFGVMFSVVLGTETLNIQILLGFVMIFIAIIISETKLSFLYKEKKNV